MAKGLEILPLGFTNHKLGARVQDFFRAEAIWGGRVFSITFIEKTQAEHRVRRSRQPKTSKILKRVKFEPSRNTFCPGHLGVKAFFEAMYRKNSLTFLVLRTLGRWILKFIGFLRVSTIVFRIRSIVFVRRSLSSFAKLFYKSFRFECFLTYLR